MKGVDFMATNLLIRKMRPFLDSNNDNYR